MRDILRPTQRTVGPITAILLSTILTACDNASRPVAPSLIRDQALTAPAGTTVLQSTPTLVAGPLDFARSKGRPIETTTPITPARFGELMGPLTIRVEPLPGESVALPMGALATIAVDGERVVRPGDAIGGFTQAVPLVPDFDLTVSTIGPPGTGVRIWFEAELKPVHQIDVLPAAGSLAPGEQLQFAAVLKASDGSILTQRAVVWSSDHPSFASVDGTGLVMALADGQSTIRATSEGVSGTAALDIVTPYLPDIVFQSDRAGNHDVYTIMRDGSDLRRITSHPANDGNAWFTGDGTRIVFVSNRTGSWDVYSMALDGIDVVNLTSHPANDGSPRPSPDGSAVTFVSNRFGTDDVFVVNVDGTGLRRLTTAPGNDYWPQFTADGSKIVFGSTRDGNHEIYIVDAAGGNERNLTNHPGKDFGPHTAGGRIAWRTGPASGGEEVWVMNEDGSDKRRLTNNSYNDTGPNLTSDGSRICFTAKGPIGHEVFSINVDGTGLRNLSSRGGYDDFCWWSPDGSQLRWNRRDGRQDLWLMQADGSGKINFSNNSSVWDDGGTFNPAAYR